MKFEISPVFKNHQSAVIDLISNFESLTDSADSGSRNKIKNAVLNNTNLCIKAFKKPNAFNKIAYTFFRKSKAQRSFEYANRLLKLNILTPTPIAFFEFKKKGLIDKTFYISEQLDSDLTFRDLTQNLDYPDHENILRAFTRFTNKLHNKGVLFLDHSPGNTLIKKKMDSYDFYLVDLNRMKFGNLSFDARISNFKRLTIHASMIATMSDEMAKITSLSYKEIHTKMWAESQKFQKAYHKRRALKKKFKF